MVGDTYTKFENVANGDYLELLPVAGQEVVIHNIYHPNNVELRIVDGSGNECACYVEAGMSVLTNIYMHITEAQYLRIYNTSGVAINIAADGIITKEPA
jgi:hypothetical protein